MTRRIAIIGAGLSGLIAARKLKSVSDVKLFDKSRGVGGRMSTRYAGVYEFDHGAQYFTARDERFQSAILDAIAQGVIAPWDGRARYLKNGKIETDTGGERFVGTPRMNSWAKCLAMDLDISLGGRIVSLTRKAQKWTLDFEDKSKEEGFDFVVCAVPSVQAQALLPEDFSGMPEIKAVKMDACFALMVGFDGAHEFGWDSLRTQLGPASWMAANSDKPGRGKNKTALVVHSSPEWSNMHADADKAWVQAEMEASASEICGFDITSAPHRALHRWLYASVSASPQQPALFDSKRGLVACGDWCLGGRVEGAFLSGLAAADNILNSL